MSGYYLKHSRVLLALSSEQLGRYEQSSGNNVHKAFKIGIESIAKFEPMEYVGLIYSRVAEFMESWFPTAELRYIWQMSLL